MWWRCKAGGKGGGGISDAPTSGGNLRASTALIYSSIFQQFSSILVISHVFMQAGSSFRQCSPSSSFLRIPGNFLS